MNHAWTRTLLIASALFVLASTDALAQYRSPVRRPQRGTLPSAARGPTVSPWLNMLRPSFGGVPNYYTLVRPEFDFYRAENQAAIQINQLQGETKELQQQTLQLQSTIRPTGTPSVFLNTMGYFPGASGGAR